MAAGVAALSWCVVPVGAAGDVSWVAVVDHEGILAVEAIAAPSISEAVRRLRQAGGQIVTVTPDVEVRATVDDTVQVPVPGDPLPVTPPPGGPVGAASDPMRSQQWGLDAVPFEAAQAVANPAGVVVAVLDTGVDAGHEDLAGMVLPGIDLVDGSGDARTDPSGHGTHVAGIVAATAGNGRGIVGAAAGVSILPVRVLDADGSGWSSDVVEGIRWAADAGADVINLSLGSTGSGSAYREVIRYAVHDRGAVVVAAAGNGYLDGNPTHYPAADPDALAVAATTSLGLRASYSTTGSWVDVAAPGQGIVAPCAPARCSGSVSQYAWMSGTSMATPFAAAAAALLRAAHPHAHPADVKTWLTSTAADLGVPGVDVEFGAGLVNPLNALAQADGAPSAPGDAGVTQPGSGTVRINWSAPALFDLAGFRVERDGVFRASLGPAARSYEESGLTPGVSYTFVVRGVDLLGLLSIPLTVTVTASEVPVPAPPSPAAGYWVVGADGRVAAAGSAPLLPDLGGRGVTVVAAAATLSGRGYWLAGSDGSVAAFGDAPFLGSMAAEPLNSPIVGLAATPTGAGYWMLGADGGVFSFGDAAFYGSTGGIRLNRPVVDMAATPTGRGYWLVASDGGVFSFGDARFHGSTGGLRLNQPVVSLTRGDGGYWLVAEDGGIFAFGVPFWGSLPGLAGAAAVGPVTGVSGKRIRATAGGAGYYILATDGQVFAFGAANQYGRAPFPAVDLLLVQ